MIQLLQLNVSNVIMRDPTPIFCTIRELSIEKKQSLVVFVRKFFIVMPSGNFSTGSDFLVLEMVMTD